MMKTRNFIDGKELIKVNDSGVLTIRQVSEKLQVSLPWLYRMTRTGAIPHVRIGGMIRFRQKDIDAWLEHHKVKETTESKA